MAEEKYDKQLLAHGGVQLELEAQTALRRRRRTPRPNTEGRRHGITRFTGGGGSGILVSQLMARDGDDWLWCPGPRERMEEGRNGSRGLPFIP